jgi:hypothetical protein
MFCALFLVRLSRGEFWLWPAAVGVAAPQTLGRAALHVIRLAISERAPTLAIVDILATLKWA